MVHALRFTSQAIQARWKLDPGDLRFSTLLDLNQSVMMKDLGLSEEIRQGIFKHPGRAIKSIQPDDIEWLIENKADLTGERSQFEEDCCLHTFARHGLIGMMSRVGDLARFYDDPESLKARILASGYKKTCIGDFKPVLHVACSRQWPNIQMLRVLVEECGVDINSRALATKAQYGTISDSVPSATALHTLAKADYWWQIDGLRYLVGKGAKVDVKNIDGQTAIHIACGPKVRDRSSIEYLGFWKPNAVKVLLESGADPNALDDEGKTPLHHSSWSIETMKILVDYGADCTVGTASPLFSTLSSLNPEATGFLLDIEVNVDAIDTIESFHIHYTIRDQIRYALFCACFPYDSKKDDALLVKVLIQRGANLYVALNEQETLLHYIFEKGEFKIASAFLEHANTIDFNARNQLGRNVLHAACNSSRTIPGYRHEHWYPKQKTPAVQLLYDHKVDHLVTDNQEAVMGILAHNDMKKLLHQANNRGYLPIHNALRALRALRLPILHVLLEMGADSLLPDPTGYGPLHHIASQILNSRRPYREGGCSEDQDKTYYTDCIDLWKSFIKQGVPVNARDEAGNPPLFVFIKCGRLWKLPSYPPTTPTSDPEDVEDCHIRTFHHLFDHQDFQVDAVNNDLENALHILAKSGNNDEHDKALFKFLVEKGLDPLAEDKRGRSSLDVAAAMEKTEILELFQFKD
ncbi:ankyrin repeat-containing domain protein [Halenospora varia]|nr:ankyrin repeat-containing domain protein [Halenospora varia]